MIQVPNKNQIPKLVIVCRQDISAGYKVVQSAHAVTEFAYYFPKQFTHWKDISNTVVALGIPTERDLVNLYRRLDKSGADVVIFSEPDIEHQATAICLYGSPEVRKKLSNYPLLLKEAV